MREPKYHLYLSGSERSFVLQNLVWFQVLYGITGGAGKIVSVVLTQIGIVGGALYLSWYGFDDRVEW